MEQTNDMLGKRQRGTYLTINGDGKFVQSFKEPVPGTIQRTNKNNKVVHEMFFDFITGYVKSVSTKDHKDFGKQWEIVLTKGDNRVIITLGYASNYAKPFLKMLPNVDLGKELEISPSAKVENGEKKTSLFLKQDDKLVPYAFKNGDGSGMPDRKLIKVKGKDQWDYTDQLEFLQEVANKKLGQADVEDVAESDNETTLEDIVGDGDEDGLPKENF